MNCRNCGAPMKLAENRSYFVCAYCTTFHFPDATNENNDGVTLLGELTGKPCPVCSCELEAATVESQRVMHCRDCRGVLATNDAFRCIVNMRRALYEKPASSPRPIDREELTRHVSCPLCEEPMDVHPYYGPGNIVVDTCHRCHLIWLDHGEITAVQEAPGQRWGA